MYPQIDYSRSGKVALVAFVWIFSTVLFQMFPQIALLRRGLVTVVTFVWLFYTVRFQMLHQIACLRRGIVALVAFVWLFPHMCGKTHLFTESSCVAFTTQVCFIADMCGNNQICVRKPHRDVLGFFHTCVVKHTHGLISPWNHGEHPQSLCRICDLVMAENMLNAVIYSEKDVKATYNCARVGLNTSSSSPLLRTVF